MLSIFPQLLPFTLLGVFIIRLLVGLVIFYFSYQILFKKRKDFIKKINKTRNSFSEIFVWILGITTLISSSFMIIGFLTQISSLICGYLILNIMFLDSGENKILGQTKLFYLTLAVICFSFIFLGAGFFAIDLPI